MENKRIDLLESANYLIRLYYRTNQEYSCTRTKIGKLLSIVAFKYARKGEQIFVEPIYKYNNCGSAITEIMNRYDKEIYSCFQYNDGIFTIPNNLKDEKSLDEEILKKYEVCNLDEKTKCAIMDVFLRFGAYSPTLLGECINCIVSKSDLVTETGEIRLSKLIDLTLQDFKNCNPIAEPLLKYLFD